MEICQHGRLIKDFVICCPLIFSEEKTNNILDLNDCIENSLNYRKRGFRPLGSCELFVYNVITWLSSLQKLVFEGEDEDEVSLEAVFAGCNAELNDFPNIVSDLYLSVG